MNENYLDQVCHITRPGKVVLQVPCINWRAARLGSSPHRHLLDSARQQDGVVVFQCPTRVEARPYMLRFVRDS